MKGLDLKGLFRKLPSQCLPLEVEETGSKRTPFISLPPEMMNEPRGLCSLGSPGWQAHLLPSSTCAQAAGTPF